MMLMHGATGLRRGELIALRWKDVDFDRKLVNVTHSVWHNIEGDTKTAASRKPVPVPDGVLKELQGWRKVSIYRSDEDYLFPSTLKKGVRAKAIGDNSQFGADALEYSTASGYLSYINNHLRPKWGNYRLTEMRPMLVQDWLRKLHLAPKTKGGLRSLMHRLFEKAMLWELFQLQRNPIDLVEVKGITKRAKKPIVLTPEQYESIMGNIPDEPYKTMVIVAMCLGLRVSEILALRWSDVDFENLTMRVTRKVVSGRVSKVKTEYSEDDLPLAEAFAERLRCWCKACPKSESDWMFPSPISGKPYWASEIQKDYLVPAGKKIGIDNLGWHTLRHTYRSLLDATGAPVGVQQKLMRHAQVSTTMNIYGNAQMDSKREAHGKVVRIILKG